MSYVARFLLTIAAVFLAVNPVMACCITGHTQDVSVVQTLTPSCHDAGDAAESSKHLDSSENSCPGCLDCDTAVLQAQSPVDALALDYATSLKTIPPSAQNVVGMHAPRLLRATGPPRLILVSKDTPISLKQLLLI